MDTIRHTLHTVGSHLHPHHAAPSSSPAAEATPQDAFAGSVSPSDALPDPRAAFTAQRRSSGGTIDASNPQIGTAEPAPELVAGARQSPKFLGTEAEYFKEARSVIENAKPGDVLNAQMYEFQNAATNSQPGATSAPGYQDQQAILPGLADAANRGVKVNVILDASKDRKTGQLNNQPIVDYLREHAGQSGNLTLDYYPPETVNIDHAKELVHLTPTGDGKYAVQEALTGGSNWGNHTPANDDGGGAFYGPDAMGAAQIFYRDQAFSRGDRTAPANPADNLGGPVQWKTTSPTAEGGGSTGILDTKLAATKDASNVYVNQFCLTNQQLVGELEAKGADAHVRLDPNEQKVNQKAFDGIQAAGGQARWANTQFDPAMKGQLNHEKLDVYADANDNPIGATIGSANDTENGLDTTHMGTDWQTGQQAERKTNHEIDAYVTPVTDGDYSTLPFLQAAENKTKNDLATDRSVDTPPPSIYGTQPGQF